MSKRIRLFVAVALALFAVQSSQAQTPQILPQNSSMDEAAIRKIVQQVEDGWNANDGKAFAAPFAPDADYVVVNGMKIKGREAIEQGHTMIFTTIYKGSHNAGKVKGLRFLRPDVAVVHVEWNLEFHTGDKTEKGGAMNTMVVTKEGGKWSIAAFHNTPIQSVAER